MEIKWHTDTCFSIKAKKKTIVINPNREAGKLKGEMVLSSLADPAEVEGVERTFDWPGEYEMKNVPIVGMKAWIQKKSESEEEGGEGKSTTIFCFAVGKVKFCHLGELGHSLTSEMLERIGDVDVLMIKVGDKSHLDSKQAMEVIEAIEPRIVIPMGTDKVAEALKDIGADKIEAIDSLEIKSRKDLPEEQMNCVILNPSSS
jgi:L-ascorbate metabolism protein UlaG (beta-lactamase superfamily)